MANEKGPNIKKKQKCKNCEGKGLLKKGDKVVKCQRCGRDRGTLIARRRYVWPASQQPVLTINHAPVEVSFARPSAQALQQEH